MSGHDSRHGPSVLVESEVVPENHRLELLVEVRVLTGDVLELLEGVLEGRRAAQLLEVLRSVVQNSVVRSKEKQLFILV